MARSLFVVRKFCHGTLKALDLSYTHFCPSRRSRMKFYHPA
ncbi:unnamed protein product [Strongylus vulgaris]|uniref:Uncharacterized protein n=1 Tax=Strongylus vulgaris TaxID=40348 RepID=A0A3P7L294_STRVU|nr:unnamed protein product [Strongylus vulgaris]